MKCRYFIIEPAFSDPDTFCRVTIGGERVRASIQIYPDEWMLYEVAAALIDPDLAAEMPSPYAEDWEFHLQLSVLPGREGQKVLRVRIWHDYEEDGTPYRADIRLQLTPKEATELSQELTFWLKRKGFFEDSCGADSKNGFWPAKSALSEVIIIKNQLVID